MLDYVMKHPSQAVDIWSSIQSGLIVEQHIGSAGAQKSDEPEAMGVASFRKVLREFKVQCFLALGDKMDKSVFEAMHLADPHSIDDVFTQLFKIDHTDKIPQDCQDPRVMTLALRYRQEEIGRNVKVWFEKSVKESGEVDWLAMPIYKMHWKAGILEKVTHCSGAVASDLKVMQIHEKYTLENPCSDQLACYVWRGSKHFLAKLFEPGTGPNTHMLDKGGNHLKVLYKQANDEIDTKRAAVKALLDAPMDVDLDQRQKRQREEALARARASRHTNSAKKLRALALEPRNSDA